MHTQDSSFLSDWQRQRLSIHVDRAVTELRRGRPVLIADRKAIDNMPTWLAPSQVWLFAAVETLTPEGWKRLRQLGRVDFHLLLSGQRIEALARREGWSNLLPQKGNNLERQGFEQPFELLMTPQERPNIEDLSWIRAYAGLEGTIPREAALELRYRVLSLAGDPHASDWGAPGKETGLAKPDGDGPWWTMPHQGINPPLPLAREVLALAREARLAPAVVCCQLLSEDARALLDAANLGGDTDTIGAIAGAILGSVLGVEAFDTATLTQVELTSHLDLPSIALELLALRAASEPTASTPEASETEDTSEGASPEKPAPASYTDSGVGRVVLMGQILVDLAVRGDALPGPGGDVWAVDEGMHVGGGFNALVAARRMGAEAVSLSPIGSGPRSSLIQAALEHEGITDLGPRIAGIDNGFCIAFTDRTGERTFISTKGAETMSPASAWADFVRTMHPGDVLYIDGYLMDHPVNREAAEAALRVLPEGVRVVLDVSPVIGIPSVLPSDGVIVSMNHREAQEIARQRGDASVRDQCLQPREAARAMLAALGRPVLLRAGAEGAYFVRSCDAALSAPDTDPSYIPTPRVEAIDTNGAGDAHSGVLAASLAQGLPLKRALLLANCAGALSTTVVGPASCPPREEIEAAADALEASTEGE